ncbi:hypothetical protein ASPZODRAFT_129662 [Penicilliopsis zonata CBS 506.65]|uniref:Small ribosomal subunit protein mS35 mitochondrial conserved domain-containing protein n=1 Tax=Penicilliopsis zonata CBS 506.65 TaxID=1073090 RepID=A0A1L9SQ51_9EURO|nr:hypothetical protein ASPZODRAFT_129662 [Penicilliopsis zonata CBS 506.65]OJJ49246.1 hypothetical protein ASPZODRAFT_129662 [Penicilliopsis zonata CBS 506.65]
MATTARSLGRSAFSFTFTHAARRNVAAGFPRARWFSASPSNLMPEDPPVPASRPTNLPDKLPNLPEYSPENFGKEDRSMYSMMSPEDRAVFDAHNRKMVEDFNDPVKRKQMLAQLDKLVERQPVIKFDEAGLPRNNGFWAEEEEDEFAQVEDADDEFHDDDITSMAHAELEVHREIREYARIAAWDMPALSSLAEPFTLPPKTHLLRFRYTTYMGEQHPAESKVVVELCSKDLVPDHLTEAQRQTFLKLVGPRYNPQTDTVRMSCEKFVNRAQNKRYLGELVGSLLHEAKNGDAFADIPLDTRHHRPKTNLRFPDEWVMTEQRQKQLAARRAERLALEQDRLNDIVDGNAVVAHAVNTIPSLTPGSANASEEPERVGVRVAAKAKKTRRL